MISKIFISRNAEDTIALKTYCSEQAIDLEALSLIGFSPIDFETPERYDVVFFSSIRAAIFSMSKLDKSKVAACIGAATADKVKALGFDVRFIGSMAGDPDTVALEFKAWLGERRVFIPSSTLSVNSISNVLEPSQIDVKEVYETIHLSKEMGLKDLYIFSSPSNFRSFLEVNVLPVNSKTIAWGKSTSKAMKEAGITPTYVLETGSEEEIITILQGQ
jgi:uroporphyrinogen-III synthase